MNYTHYDYLELAPGASRQRARERSGAHSRPAPTLAHASAARRTLCAARRVRLRIRPVFTPAMSFLPVTLH